MLCSCSLLQNGLLVNDFDDAAEKEIAAWCGAAQCGGARCLMHH